jgi:hypothetical protein
MNPYQELPMNKEIAPDQQAYWGDSKNISTLDHSFAYLKSLAYEKGINVHKTQDGFIVSQWCMAKHITTEHELKSLLKKMGVKI